jgi:hypothetical protein
VDTVITLGFERVILILALAILPSVSAASPVTVTASQTAIIVSPDNSETRLLVTFLVPTVGAGQEIHHAEIKFELNDLPKLVEFELSEINTAWSSGSVSWVSPWNTAGGDIREGRAGTWISDERTGSLIKFDITESLRRLLSGEVANYGFIVLVEGAVEAQLALPVSAPVVTVYAGP